MAKLHSRKKGNSGRKMPKSKVEPKWFTGNVNETKEVITRMVKEGIAFSKIGTTLRDKYGVPNARAALGMNMSAFVKKEGLAPEYPEDMLNLIKRAINVRAHLKTCKGDIANKVKLSHIESKIGRLAKYYSSTGRIPRNWKYDPERAVLLVK